MRVGPWLAAAAALSWSALSVLAAAPPPAANPRAAAGVDAGSEEFFEREIRPVLARQCLECHGPRLQQAGLRLDSRAALLATPANGSPSVVPGEPERSPLIHALRYQGKVRMPPQARLPERAIQAFEAWVRAGAPWPESRKAVRATGLSPTWALEPVRRPAVPRVRNRAWVKTPVDAFVLARLEAKGLAPAPPADRRTLIRRVTFDLTGLPPTPEAVDAFLADPSPNAYEKVVDRLLASRQYGERWGRHWLDVVRYADTAGETADFPAPQAWHYRNYVIDALNADRPYNQFLREQIAGDVLAQRELARGLSSERYAEYITATGYLAIARRFGFDSVADQYLTLEDTIDTLGKSVLGLTLGCARCHDHKYDPITAADYYGLYGIFESTRYAFPGCEKEKQPRDLVPLLPPAEAERRTAAERASLEKELAESGPALERARAEVAALSSGPAHQVVKGEVPEGGASEVGPGLEQIRVKRGDFLQLVVLPQGNHGADSTLVDLEVRELGGEGRTWNVARDLVADRPRWGKSTVFAGGAWLAYDVLPGPSLLTRFTDGNNGTPGLVAWRGAGSEPLILLNTRSEEIPYFSSRMPARSFGVHPGPKGGVGLAWQSPIEGVVSVRGRISDLHPGGPDGVAWVLEHRPGFADALPRVTELSDRVERTRERLAALQSGAWIERAYAVSEATPRNARIHLRGEPKTLGDEVPRKFLDRLGGQRVTGPGSGRLELADWLASPSNPLTARVMVNRVWQGHFGSGLVATPNDFGTRGAPPTHPELLDWLAATFVAPAESVEARKFGSKEERATSSLPHPHTSTPGLGWSLKRLHRLLLLSSTYRMASAPSLSNPQSAIRNPQSVDPDNRLLWRFPRRRLSAEEIRDSLLATSGDLDPTPGGAHPFPPESQWSFTQHTPFLAVYETNRRSVYLMTQRIRRHPFLALFDGADPSASTAERVPTTVPTQALFFLNNPFLHARAESLAARLLREAADDRGRVEHAYRLLYGRPAAEAEIAEALGFLRDYRAALPSGAPEERGKNTWAAYARVLFGSSEFIYVD